MLGPCLKCLLCFFRERLAEEQGLASRYRVFECWTSSHAACVKLLRSSLEPAEEHHLALR